MGSFNTICGVSRHIVTCGEPVVLLALVCHGETIPAAPGCYNWDRYQLAMHLPLYATYDDYGNFDIEDNDAYQAFQDMVKTHIVCDEDRKINIDDLFDPNKLIYQDLMHGEQLFIQPASSFMGSKKSPVMFMVIKRKVYDLMVAEYDRTLEQSWNKDYAIESHKKIREVFAKLEIRDPDKKRLTKEELQLRMEEIEKAPEIIRAELTNDLCNEYLSMGFSWEYDSVINIGMGPYSKNNLTNRVIKFTAANAELHIGLRKFVSMLCELNIEFNPQQYGSQDNDHLYHADLMTRIVVAGAENDQSREYPLKIHPKLVVDLNADAVSEYVSANKWKENPDLIHDENGNLVPSMRKYGEFNEISNIVEFKEV
ncbi:hypothetical protein CL89_gp304 [Aeromonas phage PX29]|uniref:Uncharacterized protein n=1 Tax=Aeromonas phage PX29 TaxID=926067 RepID=E5DQA7_9CAUD|nr:hypothetical protein CL89_gp304 [Aeromonas phage PX29]ADQ52893.1 conserved hypothetical protein [Aeromonas phage PX29]